MRDDFLILDIIGGAPSNVLGYLKTFQRCFNMVLGPWFSKKSHFAIAKISKNGRYGFSNCVATVHVRNNSFSGLSNESIANILVEE